MIRGNRASLLLPLLAVGAAFAIAAAGLAAWPDPAPVADFDSPRFGPQLAPVRERCDTCGIIEAIRHQEAKDGAAEAFVFAVRLPDGSLRHSTATLRGNWQVGESMQLLGGGRTWSSSP